MRTQKSKKRKSPPPQEAGRRNNWEKARINAREAALHLRLIQHGTHIVEMYRKFFPEEFTRDGVDYVSAGRLLASYDRFAELVDERLFPVHSFGSNDLLYEEPEGALFTMCLCYHSFAPFLWYNRGERGDQMFPVERLIVSAAGYGDTELRPPGGCRFSSEKLQEVCWKQKGIVSRLWLAAMALLGGTGNVWLDVTEEEYWQAEPPEWSEGQVEWLAGEFEEAKRMSDDVNGFFAWVGNDPERIEQVKRLLRRAQVPDTPVRARVRAAGDPTPLAEALGIIQ